MKIMLICNTSFFLTAHWRRHVQFLLEKGHEVHCVCKDFAGMEDLSSCHNLTFHKIQFARKISLFLDVICLWKLITVMASVKPDITHSATPKPGLLSALASSVCRIKLRFHTYTGQVWMTKRNFSRLFFKKVDKFINLMCTQTLADSLSQKQFLEREFGPQSKPIMVIGEGSVSGLNLKKFSKSAATRKRIRSELMLDEKKFLAIFLGRVTKDKGISELLDAYSYFQKTDVKQHLLICGPIEGEKYQVQDFLSLPNITYLPVTNVAENYLNAADVLVLPSYREGFGKVVIEAAAVGIPSIGSDIIGLKDAIKDGKTGLLVPSHSALHLIDAIDSLSSNHERRIRMGIDAEKRARELFDDEQFLNHVLDFYDKMYKSLDTNG